jgi:hypothetical protein
MRPLMRLLCSILLGLTAGLPYGALASLGAQDHAAQARAAVRYLEKGERSDGGTRSQRGRQRSGST